MARPETVQCVHLEKGPHGVPRHSSNANMSLPPLLQLLMWRNANLVREAASGSAAAPAPAAEPAWFIEAAGRQGDGPNSAGIQQLQLRRAQLQAQLQQQQVETANRSGDGGGGHDRPDSAGNSRTLRQQAHQQQVEAFIRGGDGGGGEGGNSSAQ